MKRRIIYTSPIFPIAIVSAGLILVGVMQFVWLSRSTTSEIRETHHALNSAVNQIYGREYQRYAPLLAILRDVGKDGATLPTDSEKPLARILELYGSRDSDQGIVQTVGIAPRTSMTSIKVLTHMGTWAPPSKPLPFTLSATALKGIDEGKIIFVYGTEQNDREFLVARAGAESVAIVEIDTRSFFENFVKPSIESLFPGSTVTCENTEVVAKIGESDANRRRETEREWSTFNPLHILLGFDTVERRTFRTSTPETFESFYGRENTSYDGKKIADIGEFNYRDPQDGSTPDYQNARRMKTVIIVLSRKSAVAVTEFRQSMTWMLNVLFLLGIGFAFAITIIQKDKLRKVGEREREFVASVTHELRTPVTAIRSAAHNMRKGLVGPERMATYGEMMYAQSIRLGSMIEEMLLFSQVEGRIAQQPTLGEIITAELVAEMCPPLDEIGLASGLPIRWNFGALPERFHGDKDSIMIIINNLVANALYHAYTGIEKGEVRVTGRISVPNHVQFIVEDDGRGIQKSDARLVFEPFYRDSKSREKYEKGSGLGLFIARRKAEIMGATLSLESPYKRIDETRRQGCRFILEIPLKLPVKGAMHAE